MTLNDTTATSTAAGTAMGTDDPRVERTRAAVIAAAAALMLSGGPDVVTHASVAGEANVSRTTVYKHWPTRADLLRSTIEELGTTFPDRGEFTGDVRADLQLLLANLADDLRDDSHTQLIGMMMARAQYDGTMAAVRDDMICEGTELFGQVIASAKSNGQLRHDLDPGLAMASLAGTLLFMRFMSGSLIDDDTLAHVVDEFIASNAPR